MLAKGRIVKNYSDKLVVRDKTVFLVWLYHTRPRFNYSKQYRFSSYIIWIKALSPLHMSPELKLQLISINHYQKVNHFSLVIL